MKKADPKLLRCVVVNLVEGAPLVAVALDLAERLGGAGKAAGALFEAWERPTDLPIAEDSTIRMVLNEVAVCISAERFPVEGRLVSVLLMVAPADAGIAPTIVETLDLRGQQLSGGRRRLEVLQ